MKTLVRMFLVACAIRLRSLAVPAAVLLFAAIGALAAEPMVFHNRARARTAPDTNKVEVVEKSAQLDSTQATAVTSAIKKRIVMIIGENEYSTWETLPEFARQELVPRGYQVSTVAASPKDDDPNFQNFEAIRDADLVVVSVRRRTPPKAMIELLRAHVAAGKAVVGLRTASHAFQAAPASADFTSWNGFDVEVLGGRYDGHYNNKPPAAPHSLIEIVRSNATHLVLTGMTSHLYKNRRLAPTVVPLLQGRVEGQDTVEPVAWVNTAKDRRVFYTSLGNVDDFNLPAFRRLLLNGILWCLHDPVPPPATPKN
jgi:type 1 glutamine amidotransferase